jgi:hypothetical protein
VNGHGINHILKCDQYTPNQCLNLVIAEDSEGRPPISVKFEIPYFTVSGIQVRYLKIIEKTGYQSLPWVRYITQNGGETLQTDTGYQLTVLFFCRLPVENNIGWTCICYTDYV